MVGIIKTQEGILFYTRKPWEKKIYLRMKRLGTDAALIYCNNEEELERAQENLTRKGYKITSHKHRYGAFNSSPVKIKDVLDFAVGYLVVSGYVWDEDFMSLMGDYFKVMSIPDENYNGQLLLR